MPRTYKGKYTVKHPSKYKGNLEEVVYRSNWEKSVMIWLDNNSEVAKWNSEDFVVPYYYDVDKKWHKYHVDFWIKFKNGNVLLVEVKPKKQTEPPKSKIPRSRRSLNEAFTYIKNRNKWEAAQQIAQDNGYKFAIWTEDELTKMKIINKTPGKLKKLKPLAPFKKKKN